MKTPTLAVLLATAAVAACTSVPAVKGPFARSGQAATTQTDAGADTAAQEQSPFPVQSPFGN